MASSVTASYVFTVAAAPLSITSAAPPPALVGSAFSFTFTAGGGIPPYTWTMSPTIPGLSLDTNTGELSGVPLVPGSTPIDVTVTDSAP